MRETFLWYCFYIESKDMDKDFELYAYTDSKKLAKRFQKERDMTKFIMKTYYLTVDEVHNLAENYNEMYLEIFQGKTKVNTDGFHIVEFSMVVTKMEKLNVLNFTSDLIFAKLWLLTNIDPKCFRPEYSEALDVLGYTDGYEYFYSDKESKKSLLEFGFEPDFLSTFLHFYKDLMKA